MSRPAALASVGAGSRAESRRGMRARVLSAVILLPAALAAAHFGSPAFDVMLIVAAAMMAREWARLTAGDRIGPAGLMLAATVIAVAVWTAGRLSVEAGVVGVALGAVALYVYARWRQTMAPLWLAAGAVAIGLPVIAFGWLRSDPIGGRAVIYWIFAVVWATDTGAYAVGSWLGGPRLSPRISPNKTWAGLLGGVAFAALVGGVGARLAGAADPPLFAGVAVATALVAQFGDLAESLAKRRFGVKDTGGIIPGHGGLLDRVDSLLAVAPVLALLSWLTGCSPLAWTAP